MIWSLTIAAMFFVSGAASLVFEMAWFYRAGLVLGNSVWAASITVSSFMGGLAIGNALMRRAVIRHPLRAYALAEITVAATSVMAVSALATRAPLALLTRLPAGRLWMADVIRLTVTFLLFLLPATAMGTTLPMLVGELSRRRLAFGSALGRLYGWNTLGAVAGALFAEVVLIRRVGVAGSAWIAALLDAAVATAALALARQPRADSTAERTAVASITPIVFGRALPVAAGLAGALLLGLEVVWFRFLSMYVLSTTFAMSVMLAIVLGGIGIGGLVASRWFAMHDVRRTDIATAAFVAGCAVVVSYGSFQTLTAGTQAGGWGSIAWFAIVLTLPTSVVSGILFTVIGDTMARRGDRAERTAAAVALANTIGATCGPLIASFVLLPALGMERTLFIAAGGYAVLGVIAIDRPFVTRRRARVVAAMGCFVALAAFPFGLMAGTYFERAVAPSSVSTGSGAA